MYIYYGTFYCGLYNAQKVFFYFILVLKTLKTYPRKYFRGFEKKNPRSLNCPKQPKFDNSC